MENKRQDVTVSTAGSTGALTSASEDGDADADADAEDGCDGIALPGLLPVKDDHDNNQINCNGRNISQDSEAETDKKQPQEQRRPTARVEGSSIASQEEASSDDAHDGGPIHADDAIENSATGHKTLDSVADKACTCNDASPTGSAARNKTRTQRQDNGKDPLSIDPSHMTECDTDNPQRNDRILTDSGVETTLCEDEDAAIKLGQTMPDPGLPITSLSSPNVSSDDDPPNGNIVHVGAEASLEQLQTSSFPISSSLPGPLEPLDDEKMHEDSDKMSLDVHGSPEPTITRLRIVTADIPHQQSSSTSNLFANENESSETFPLPPENDFYAIPTVKDVTFFNEPARAVRNQVTNQPDEYVTELTTTYDVNKGASTEDDTRRKFEEERMRWEDVNKGASIEDDTRGIAMRKKFEEERMRWEIRRAELKKEEERIKKESKDTERHKINLYMEAMKSHAEDGAGRCFADYWDALGRYLSISENETIAMRSDDDVSRNGIGATLARFLSTRTLKKLHNLYVKSIMKQCLETKAPRSRIKKHIPIHWREVKDVDVQNSDEHGVSLAIHESARERCTRLDMEQICSIGEDFGMHSAAFTNCGSNRMDSSSMNVTTEDHGRVSNNKTNDGMNEFQSPRLPGTLEVFHITRKITGKEGYCLSQSAQWLTVVTIRDYLAQILQNTMNYLDQVDEVPSPEDSACQDTVGRKRKRRSITNYDLVQVMEANACNKRISMSSSLPSSRLAWEHFISNSCLSTANGTNAQLEKFQNSIGQLLNDAILKRQNEQESTNQNGGIVSGFGQGKNLLAMRRRHSGQACGTSVAGSTSASVATTRVKNGENLRRFSMVSQLGEVSTVGDLSVDDHFQGQVDGMFPIGDSGNRHSSLLSVNKLGDFPSAGQSMPAPTAKNPHLSMVGKEISSAMLPTTSLKSELVGKEIHSKSLVAWDMGLNSMPPLPSGTSGRDSSSNPTPSQAGLNAASIPPLRSLEASVDMTVPNGAMDKMRAHTMNTMNTMSAMDHIGNMNVLKNANNAMNLMDAKMDAMNFMGSINPMGMNTMDAINPLGQMPTTMQMNPMGQVAVTNPNTNSMGLNSHPQLQHQLQLSREHQSRTSSAGSLHGAGPGGLASTAMAMAAAVSSRRPNSSSSSRSTRRPASESSSGLRQGAKDLSAMLSRNKANDE